MLTKILMVDDHPENLITLEAVLKNPEYVLVKCTSGQEALKALLRDEFAVILLDVMMPEMDGFTLASLIKKRAQSRSTPIIFLTALAKEIEYIYKGYMHGGVDYLTKPLQPEVVSAKVSVFVELHRKTLQIKAQEEELRKSEKLVQDLHLAEIQISSDRRYKMLADAMPQMVWTTRPDGVIDYTNRRWLDFNGRNLLQGSSWNSYKTFLHPDDRSNFLKEWETALQCRELFEIQCRLLDSKTSVYRWHLCRAVCEQNSLGEVVAWLGTCTDIDEQKQAEKKQQDANHMKDAFLSMISNELRTPLDKVTEGAAGILSVVMDEKIQHGLKEIIHHGKILTHLVNDLVDVSHIVSGHMRIDVQLVDFKSLVTETIKLCLPSVEGKKISLKSSIPMEETKWVNGDAARLQQVLFNVISNAVKFTPEGGDISLTLVFESENLVLTVSDTGIGITADLLPLVFESFRQANHRTLGGLGLGLTIAAQIMKLHGGSVNASSHGANKGTTLTLTLPIARSTTHRLPGKTHSSGLYKDAEF